MSKIKELYQLLLKAFPINDDDSDYDVFDNEYNYYEDKDQFMFNELLDYTKYLDVNKESYISISVDLAFNTIDHIYSFSFSVTEYGPELREYTDHETGEPIYGRDINELELKQYEGNNLYDLLVNYASSFLLNYSPFKKEGKSLLNWVQKNESFVSTL